MPGKFKAPPPNQGGFGFGTFRKPLRDATMLRDFPELNWLPPEVKDLPSWADAKDVSVDVETCDPNVKALGPGTHRGDAFIAGIGFSIEDGPSYYLPIAHEPGGNLDKEHVLQYVRDQSKVFKGTLVGANLGYEHTFLGHEGIFFPHRKIDRDVLTTDVLIDENLFSYNLDAVANRWGLPGKDETLLRKVAEGYGVDPKVDLWRLPPAAVGAYAERDVQLPHLIRRRQEKRIDEVGLWEVYDLESELLPILIEMRRRGIKVNENKIDNLETWSWVVEAECSAQIKEICGYEIGAGNFNDKKALATVLRLVGIIPPPTPTGKDSIKNGWLRTLKHPIGKIIIRAREFWKLRTMFCQKTREFIVKGRIHPTFGQVKGSYEEEDGEDDDDDGAHGTRFGRCFSKKPNFQFQPKRNPEFGKKWRAIYEADSEDDDWVSADMSQQEPRIVIHYAELCNLNGAKEAADRYRSDPTTDNHQMLTDWVLAAGALTDHPKPRDVVKNIYNALSYGSGEGKMAFGLGMETYKEYSEKGNRTEEVTGRKFFWKAGAEAKKVFETFHRVAPFVKELAKMVEEAAKSKGFVKAGIRHCHFVQIGVDQYGRPIYKDTYKALNRVAQGEAANQTKKIMVKLHKMGVPMNSTVHDEINWCRNRRYRKELKEIKYEMENVVQHKVPHLAQIEIGPSWGEGEKVKDFDNL